MYVLVKFNSYFPFKLLAFKNPSPLEFLLTLLGVGRDIVWNCTFEIFKRIRQSQQWRGGEIIIMISDLSSPHPLEKKRFRLRQKMVQILTFKCFCRYTRIQMHCGNTSPHLLHKTSEEILSCRAISGFKLWWPGYPAVKISCYSIIHKHCVFSYWSSVHFLLQCWTPVITSLLKWVTIFKLSSNLFWNS